MSAFTDVCTEKLGATLEWATDMEKALTKHGLAVVELPEPIRDDEPTAYVAFSGSNHVYYAVPGRVDSDAFEKWEHPADARDDAAALLAAAAAAESSADVRSGGGAS